MIFLLGVLLVASLLFFGRYNFHKARTDGRARFRRMRGRLPQKYTRP